MRKHLVEIKARSTGHAAQREVLRAHDADFRGTDHQLDHYFNVPAGRLKLRSGTIEHSLIFYRRADQAGPKDSSVALTIFPDRAQADAVAATLSTALGTWVTVDKHREIYFVGNVKIHLDTVAGLGQFIEIEAIGDRAEQRPQLLEQCRTWMRKLSVTETDLVERSYSDLLTDLNRDGTTSE